MQDTGCWQGFRPSANKTRGVPKPYTPMGTKGITKRVLGALEFSSLSNKAKKGFEINI
jgi:hypothetical protein